MLRIVTVPLIKQRGADGDSRIYIEAYLGLTTHTYMCGIVGMVSTRPVRDAVMNGLQRLEYRGYDSFGITITVNDALCTKRSVGSVAQQMKLGFLSDVPDGLLAIAHTRWATHGGVSEKNAHPHRSYDGAFSLVHNGVIENWRELRARLAEAGIECVSDTDTEVIVQLLAVHYQSTHDVLEALRRTLAELEGEYALVCTTSHDPAQLYAARRKSPLCFGRAGDGFMIASDSRAFGSAVRAVTFLEDGDVVRIGAEGAEVFAGTGEVLERVTRSETELKYVDADATLAGYPHYMLKEIHEAPLAVRQVFSITPEALGAVTDLSRDRTISFTAAGSSYYAALIGQYLFADLARAYVRTHPADEIASLVPFGAHDHLIAVSQSGETFDTLETMRQVLGAGGVVSVISNVYSSSASRLATASIFQGAGQEICVLSTKSVVSQALILYRLARTLGARLGAIDAAQAALLDRDEAVLPAAIERVFAECEAKLEHLGGWYRDTHDWFFLGRGMQYPVALESALKLKEVTYAHAEGMPAGFLKHGTISLIDDKVRTMVFLPRRTHDESAYKMALSNISEVRARGGSVIVIGHDAENETTAVAESVITLPSVSKHLDPILELIAGQLFAYYYARALGRPIDQPRSLAKAVTVR